MNGCPKYACDVHFLLICMLLQKNYTTIKRLKVELQISSEDFVYSLAISRYQVRYPARAG